MTEKINKAMGLCALCGPDIGKEMVLRESHFLPKAIYRYLNRSKAEGTNILIRTHEENKIFPMGKQITQGLLCDACELLMSVEGEDYYSRIMLKVDIKKELPPPAFKALVEILLPLWNCMSPGIGYHPNMILSIGSNSLKLINSRQIYHFAIGMFWKATCNGWKHCSTMPLEASIIEDMRKFLRGGEFLAGYIVRIIPSFWRDKYGATFPALLQGQPFFSINQFDFFLEKDARQFSTAISMNTVPLFYTVDSMRSEHTFQAISKTYRNSQQAKSAKDTQLSWPADDRM